MPIRNNSSISPYLRTINCSFRDQNSAYALVSGTAYVAIAKIIFPGSTFVGIPSSIAATVSMNAGTSMKIRVYDATNALVVCEATGITSLTTIIQDLGTISNVSASQVIWEIQIAGVGSGAKATASSLQIRY